MTSMADRARALLADGEATEYAPLEVVNAIEAAIDEVLNDPDAGRAARVDAPLANVFRAVAERVEAVWLPEVSFTDIVELLVDASRRTHAASKSRPSLREDHELGWARVTADEIAVYVAHALVDSERFEEALAVLIRERAEDAAAHQRLEVARSEVSMVDILSPFSSYSENMVELATEELADDQKQTREALHLVKSHVARAFCAHPMSWLYVSLLGAAWTLDTAEAREVRVIDDQGELSPVKSGAARVVLLMCLCEVRAAAEAAFPGVPALVRPRGSAPVADEAAPGSPYRAAMVENRAADDDMAWVDAFERGGVRKPLVDAAIAGAIYGLMATEAPNEESANAWRGEHEGWMERYGNDALDIVDRLAMRHHPMLGLAATLAHASHVATNIHAPAGRVTSCPAVNKEETLHALDLIASTLLRFFHVRGERHDWMEDVAERIHLADTEIHAPDLEGISSYAEVVELLAAQLQATDFVSQHRSVSMLRAKNERARDTAEKASGRVSFWDKLNVFSDTDDEAERDRARGEARTLEEELEVLAPSLDGAFDAARSLYRPLVIAEELSRVRVAVNAIHTTSSRYTVAYGEEHGTPHREQYLSCRIHGVDDALDALAALRRCVIAELGPLPSRSDALEAWIRQAL